MTPVGGTALGEEMPHGSTTPVFPGAATGSAGWPWRHGLRHYWLARRFCPCHPATWDERRWSGSARGKRRAATGQLRTLRLVRAATGRYLAGAGRHSVAGGGDRSAAAEYRGHPVYP